MRPKKSRCRPYRRVTLSVPLAFVPFAVACALQPGVAWAQQDATPVQPPAQPPVRTFPKSEPQKTPPTANPKATPGKVEAPNLPNPLTLAQAIEYALKLQPQIASVQAQVDQAEQQLQQAKSRYYPSITPQYSYSNQYNFGPVTRTTTTQGGSGVAVTDQGEGSTTRSAQLPLSYRIYDSGVRDLNARAARQSLRRQGYTEQNTRQVVIVNVASDYFNALRAAALVKVSEAQVARAQNTLDVVTAQVQEGVSPRKDTFQAEADLQNARVNLLQQQNNAAVAQAQLKNSIGVVGGEPLSLADVPPPTPDTPSTATINEAEVGEAAKVAPGTGTASGNKTATPDAASTAINQFLERAYSTRPDIAQSQQSVEISETDVKLARVNQRVLITSDFTAALRIAPTSLDRSSGNDRQFNILLSYPLFDGGFARAQTRAAQAGVRVSEAQLAQVRQQTAVEVEQAYRNLAQSRASLPAAQAAQNAAQINFDAASASRREGVGSIVEVITAQTLLVQAQINYVQAVYDFYTADANLARAVGQADRIAAAPGTPTTTTPISPTPAAGTPAPPPAAP